MSDIRTKRRRAGRTLRVALAAAVAGSALGLTPIGVTGAATAAENTGATTAPVGSEAHARSEAERTGESVEIVSQRTEKSETYALPNGNLRQTQHTSPVRVQRDGAWKPVDTTLATAAGRVAPKAAAGHVTFSAGGDAPLVVLKDQGRELALSWPKALPKPVLDGSTATYPEVLPGVDLSVAASVDGFSQALVVKTAEAAKNPELNTVDFGLKTDGLTLKKDAESGTLTALNPAGQQVFATSTARMWDSSGTDETVAAPAVASRSLPLVKRSVRSAPAKTTPTDLTPGTNSAEVGVKLSGDGDTLSLTPDQALLDAPDTTYPVYIDPSMTGKRQAWTIAYKPHANSSYWNGTGWSGGTTSEARVGYENSTGGTARSFFRVDSKALAGVKVVDAQFQITQTHSWSCTAKPVELWLTGGISSSTTWNKQPSWSTRQDVRSSAHGNESFGCPDKAIDLEANDAAKKAAAGKWSSITFALRAPQSAEDAKDEFSWKKFKPDAKLIVEYNTPPKAPWQLDTIPSTRVSTTECGNGGSHVTIGKTDVRLTARAWDPDGGPVNVQFHLWATGKHDVAPGVFFDEKVTVNTRKNQTGGVTAQVTVPMKQLIDRVGLSKGQFSWKAQVEDERDPAFASDWTPTKGAPGCRFEFDPTNPSHTPVVTSDDGRYPEAKTGKVGAVARTPGVFRFATGDADVVKYKWSLDRTPPTTSVRAESKGKSVTDTVTPLTPGPHVLYVQTFDGADNPGPIYPYAFDVGGQGLRDKPGDVNGDGLPDLLAIDAENTLKLYGGTGRGTVAPPVSPTSAGDWSGALITHRGDLTNDGYEDLVARKSDGRIWYYPNNGRGEFLEENKDEMILFQDEENGAVLNPASVKQLVAVEGVTPGEGSQNPDFLAVIGDRLWFLPGYPMGALGYGYPIGDAGWGRMTIASPGDMNGDGFTDLVARDTTNGNVWLYQGKAHPDLDGNGAPDADGADPASIGDTANRKTFATGWTSAARPLITASGDSSEDGVPDLWTTTSKTTAGLEFVPAHRPDPKKPDVVAGTPRVVGKEGWQTVKAIS